ncbi:double zinc ribbon domain-containing protein [Sphingorhabdus sp. EL138]|uniref:ComF family protein n=1 Tax=Sphingorhabdus sp. EL138 TaxID=2073156 RepID=UPI0025D5BCAA|nr:double zinc ribbon domain-containing protein [Sphingorhabdus sp. EL138]
MQTQSLSDKSDMAKGGHIFYMMLNWVLPERCPCCGTITAAGRSFCLSCWQKLEFLGPRWCRGCAVPFDFDRGADAYCASCIAHPPRHDGIRAVVIAQQLLRHLPDDTGQVIITPVPLHWTRIWLRSFNQSALIGKHLAASTGIAFVPDILLRHKRTPSMRGLDHKRRRQAVGSAFALHPKYKGKLKGRKSS